MKLFFNSSVLVPVFYADHQHHKSSARIFLGAGKEDSCALRTLGEVHATLTGLPVRPALPVLKAWRLSNRLVKD